MSPETARFGDLSVNNKTMSEDGNVLAISVLENFIPSASIRPERRLGGRRTNHCAMASEQSQQALGEPPITGKNQLTSYRAEKGTTILNGQDDTTQDNESRNSSNKYS